MSDQHDKPDGHWRSHLTPEQFEVTRRKGTERAFSGEYHDCKRSGTYRCICCDTPLFESASKFDSGTGWPSFTSPVSSGNIRTEADHKYGMQRIEVCCRNCGAHLGHVFDDGPAPTGQRYCINSVSLRLDEDDS